MRADSYRTEREALVAAVTNGRGSLPPEARRAILDRAAGQRESPAVPGAIVDFVDRVAKDATAIRDDDVRGLLAAGLDEEAIFEAIVAAALGASLVRLERVDSLLDAGS